MRIDVIDTGPGIAPEMREKTFSTVSDDQVRRQRTRPAHGQTHCEAHGGTIDVQSAPGHGTKFAIRLPIQRLVRPHHACRLLRNATGSEARHQARASVAACQPPPDFLAALGELPDDVTLAKATAGQVNVALLFVESLADLKSASHRWSIGSSPMAPFGVCWPKKASRVRPIWTKTSCAITGWKWDWWT